MKPRRRLGGFTFALLHVDSHARTQRGRHLLWASLCCFIGAFFRESVVLGAGAMLFASNPLSWFDRRLHVDWRGLLKRALPLAAWAAGTLVVSELVTPTQSTDFGEAWRQLLAKKPHAILVALWFCFGPMLVVPLVQLRESLRFLVEHQHLLVFLGGSLALSILGGSDTERLMYWGAPVVLILFARAVGEAPFSTSMRWLIPLVLLQALSHRWCLVLPQLGPGGGLPLLTTWGESTSYLELWSSHTTPTLRLVWAGQVVVVGSLLVLWTRRHLRRHL